MTAEQEITELDLHDRSEEIMDHVERRQAFKVMRGGHQIGELIPLHRPRRFVPREAFAAMSLGAPPVDLDAFRANQDAATDHDAGDSYAR